MKLITWISTAYKAWAGWKLYAVLMITGAALVAGAGIWHSHKVDGVWNAAFKAGQEALKAKHQQELINAQQLAASTTAALEKGKADAIAEAEKRAQNNARAAAGARSELDRLRKQAATGAGDASTSHSACTQYATAATAVLQECGAALQTLAEHADGHANDVRTLTGAWPSWQQSASLTRIEMPRSPFTPTTPEN